MRWLGICAMASLIAICAALPVTCPTTQYQVSPATATSSIVCVNTTKCTSYQYQLADATATSDRNCTRYTICNQYQFQLVPTTRTSDRICQHLTACTASQFVGAAPTATSDRQCVTITTTSQPPICSNFLPLDVVFALDSSNGTTPEWWTAIKSFASNIVSYLPIGSSKVQ